MNELLVNNNPRSPFSEAIKTVRTNLLFSNKGKKVKTVLITSSKPGEGKSFIAANLAVAFAQSKKEVLIIDCDLRKGRQHDIFHMANDRKYGFSNLLLEEDNVKLEKYIKKTEVSHVSLITAGLMPPNPSELLESENTKKVIEKLKEKYDLILFDCPPVLGLNDALMMTKYSDVNIVVASSKVTKLEDLDHVKKAFENIKQKIAGVILNKVEVSKNSYYGYYSSYHES